MVYSLYYQSLLTYIPVTALRSSQKWTKHRDSGGYIFYYYFFVHLRFYIYHIKLSIGPYCRIKSLTN